MQSIPDGLPEWRSESVDGCEYKDRRGARGEGIKSIHFHMIVAKNVDHKKVFVMRIMIANPNLL